MSDNEIHKPDKLRLSPSSELEVPEKVIFIADKKLNRISSIPVVPYKDVSVLDPFDLLNLPPCY